MKSKLKALIKGGLKMIPLTAPIVNALETKKKTTDHSPEGKIDWPEVIGSAVVAITLGAYLFGYIPEEKVKFIMDKVFKYLFVSE